MTTLTIKTKRKTNILTVLAVLLTTTTLTPINASGLSEMAEPVRYIETAVRANSGAVMGQWRAYEVGVLSDGTETVDLTDSIEDQIRSSALAHGVDPATALRIATCESSLNPLAVNPNSTAQGLYQFTSPTWEWIGSPGDRLDADDSIAAFVGWYPIHPEWWECR